MIDIHMLTMVCGDPAKGDSLLLWCLDLAESDEPATIRATSEGYTIRSPGKLSIEKVHHASPLSNLQAGVEAARARLGGSISPFEIQQIIGEGVDVGEYRRYTECRSPPKQAQILPSASPVVAEVRSRGRRLPHDPPHTDRESKAD